MSTPYPKPYSKGYKRTPFGYDGNALTARHLQDILSLIMKRLGPLYATQPAVVLSVWPAVVGDKIACLTTAHRFQEGILYVKVKNSMMFSLLSNPVDKQKIQEAVRAAVPGIVLKNIVFKIG